VHVRDAKRDGSAADVGEGDLPVAEMLRFVRDSKHPIAFILEQSRSGEGTSVDKVKRNLDYLRRVLDA